MPECRARNIARSRAGRQEIQTKRVELTPASLRTSTRPSRSCPKTWPKSSSLQHDRVTATLLPKVTRRSIPRPQPGPLIRHGCTVAGARGLEPATSSTAKRSALCASSEPSTPTTIVVICGSLPSPRWRCRDATCGNMACPCGIRLMRLARRTAGQRLPEVRDSPPHASFGPERDGVAGSGPGLGVRDYERQ